MDLKSFRSALAKRLYPVARTEGFTGSGTTLRRIDGPVIHVFNLQGSSGGEQGYLNLGAHLAFLPVAGDIPAVPRALKEYECAFRDRIHPTDGASGWAYGHTPEQLAATIQRIVDQWDLQARPFFARYSSWPVGFRALLSPTTDTDHHATHCLTCARMAAHMGEFEQSIDWARRGLERAPERATALRASLQHLVDRRI